MEALTPAFTVWIDARCRFDVRAIILLSVLALALLHLLIALGGFGLCSVMCPPFEYPYTTSVPWFRLSAMTLI